MMNYLEKKKKAMLNYVSGGRLPSEYQEVEWIGSSGSQYIDTLYKPSSDTEVYVDFDFPNYQGDREIIGARENSKYYEILFSASRIWLQFGSTTPNTLFNNRTGRHIYEVIGGKLYVDDTQLLQSTSTFNQFTTRSLFIFALNNGNAERKITANLYSMKITENGNLERDLVPCYRKADDEIGLYDIVNGTFYTNAGTGTFTKGNDV